MWDSGWLDIANVDIGNRCEEISYAGTPLTLVGDKYYWRIKFKDTGDNEGPWSTEEAHFTMVDTTPTTYTVDVTVPVQPQKTRNLDRVRDPIYTQRREGFRRTVAARQFDAPQTVTLTYTIANDP